MKRWKKSLDISGQIQNVKEGDEMEEFVAGLAVAVVIGGVAIAITNKFKSDEKVIEYKPFDIEIE